VLGEVDHPPWSGFLHTPVRTHFDAPAVWVPRFVRCSFLNRILQPR
jgi:hypothetical protein